MLHHNNKCNNILTTRVGNICHKYDVDMMRLLLDTSYMTSEKKKIFSFPEHGKDGLNRFNKIYLCYIPVKSLVIFVYLSHYIFLCM